MKKIRIILLAGLLLWISPAVADAATATIKASANRSSVVVGNTVNVTVSISSGSALGSWKYTMSYDASVLKLTSGNLSVVDYGDGSIKSKTYSYSFLAIKTGSSSVTAKNVEILGWDESALSVSNSGSKVSVITQAQLEASYSKNDYLSGLGVENQTLSPEFNKDTLEYTVELDSTVEKINITGHVADNNSTVTGLGEQTVSEGDNRFEIIVTAQKGNTRTYIITAKVIDANPIEVKVDGKKYTLVKRVSSLTGPTTFVPKTVTIKDTEIPAFYSEILKYTLVGLKDSKGKIELYIYDENEKTYTRYQELTMNQLVINILDKEVTNKRYHKMTVTINNHKYTGYKVKRSSEFAIFYGVNVQTGDKGYYMYDSVEKTMQRYNTEEIDEILIINRNYLIVAAVFGISLMIAVLIIVSQNKKPPKVKESNQEQPKKKIKREKSLNDFDL